MLEIILFAPLFGSLFAALFAFSKKNIFTALVPTLALCVALIAAFFALFSLSQYGEMRVVLGEWIVAGAFESHFSFMIDDISMTMILVVLIVSLFVHIYSIGYMADDEKFNKFFAFLSAFVFSMLILVMSDNFLGLFIGWEGVGVCSWMLIGFWWQRDSASFAANEAFIMNRIADLGLLLGIFLIFCSFGGIEYGVTGNFLSTFDIFTMSLIGILLFIGAMGKSAQFPFHTWLADAMEGPTPVSALIHAATMVTAGVYLVIRVGNEFMTPSVSLFIAYLGAFVAIFAASMALVNKDLKRIIAYSTLSQLGYMFVAAGLGYYTIALFHLTTHAFFKSLLFLGAGNVMHAMNDKLDISKMGALWRPLKWTAILMIIASVALCGIYPFAGFFSKDKILEVAFVEEAYLIYGILLLGAFLTAFYSFRLIMLVFFAPKNYGDAHPHEAPKIMLYAMIPLAILSIIAGFFGYIFSDDRLHLESFTLVIFVAVALCVAFGGIFLAILIYRKDGLFWRLNKQKIQESFFYNLLFNQYFIPKIYDICFIKTYKIIANFLWKEIELKIIDFVVDFIARIFMRSGESARKLQSGIITQSLMLMTSGIFVVLALLLIAGKL